MTRPALSLELSEEVEHRLDQVSERTKRPKTSLVQEAVTDYLDQIDWKSREIEAALAEAEAGVFISHEAMLRWADNLSRQAGSSSE